MTLPAAAGFLVLAATLAGCAGVTAADRGPRGDPVARLAPATPSPWRLDFGDPVLRDLLARADAGALDPKVALARLQRADADVEDADAQGAVHLAVGAAAAFGGRNLHSTTAAATPTLEASRDLDVWGRSAHRRDAARSDRRAAEADFVGARLAVSAQTAQAYLALRAAQTAEDSWRRRRAIAEGALRLVQARAAEGFATRADVQARRTSVEAAAERVLKAREAAVVQAGRLGDLTGSPAPVELSASSLTLGPAPGDVPSGLVDNRPDLKAARARLAAADQRRAAAVAASRPQFQIVAALGAPDTAIANLLDVRALAWALAATVTGEVLDGGARRAAIHVATAEADLADLAYRQAAMSAWAEVRDALVAEAQARRALDAANEAVAAAQSALVVGEARHAAGAADGLGLAALQDSLEQATEAGALARLDVAEARVRLALALGGG